MTDAYKDPDVLEELYIEEDLTQQEVADELGVTWYKIRYWRKKHGISKPDGPNFPVTEAELREMYIEENLTQAEIADRVGVAASSTVEYWVQQYGLSKDRSAYESGPPVSEDRLRELYWDQKLSQSEIGDELGYEQTTIGNWLREYGIETRSPSEYVEPPVSKEKLTELYVEEGLGSRTIAEKLDIGRNTVQRWRDRFGIDPHPTGNRKRDDIDDELLITLYVDERLSQAEIAEKIDVDVTQTTVSRWLRDLDVEVRNQAGWGCEVETVRGETVKSALERRTANWLYGRGIEYTYEPEIDGTSYVPDFIADERLIEAWGVRQSETYDERRAKKIAAYEELGYDVISIFPKFDDRPGVDEALSSVFP